MPAEYFTKIILFGGGGICKHPPKYGTIKNLITRYFSLTYKATTKPTSRIILP